jgi:IMP dehydrogenase
MQDPSTIPVGLTYDDVLLVPRRSSVQTRREVSTTTRFTRRLSIQVPVVSANMDTVTGASMAIAMAREGGIGVLHRFLTIAQQVDEVNRVKRAESLVIEDPYTIDPEATVGDLRERARRAGVHGFPVVDAGRRLLGIVTSRDIRFEASERRVGEVMTPRERLVTAPVGTSPEQAREVLRARRIEKLPLVDGEGRLRGLITAADLLAKAARPHASADARGRLRVAAAVGVKAEFLARAEALVDAGCDALVVDVAHGHSEASVRTIRRIKERFGDAIEVVGGNVATAEGAKDLVDAGADAVKVGVGPGAACTTRIVTGAGVPQLTAIFECARVCRGAGVPLIADGGVRGSGDIAKAIAAGADCIMAGSMLAGTDESPGNTVIRDGKKYKHYRGMASLAAAVGRRERERESAGLETALEDEDWEGIQAVAAEGVEGFVTYRGSVSEILRQCVAGFRSAMSYCGARSIEEMQANARFIRMTGAGQKESGAHDIVRS